MKAIFFQAVREKSQSHLQNLLFLMWHQLQICHSFILRWNQQSRGYLADCYSLVDILDHLELDYQELKNEFLMTLFSWDSSHVKTQLRNCTMLSSLLIFVFTVVHLFHHGVIQKSFTLSVKGIWISLVYKIKFKKQRKRNILKDLMSLVLPVLLLLAKFTVNYF